MFVRAGFLQKFPGDWVGMRDRCWFNYIYGCGCIHETQDDIEQGDSNT